MLDTAALDFLVFRYVGIQRPPPFPAMSTGSLNWGSFHLTNHQPQLDIIAQQLQTCTELFWLFQAAFLSLFNVFIVKLLAFSNSTPRFFLGHLTTTKRATLCRSLSYQLDDIRFSRSYHPLYIAVITQCAPKERRIAFAVMSNELEAYGFVKNAPYVDGRRVPCEIRTTLTSGSSDLCGSRTCRMTQMHGLWTCCQCRTRNEMQFWCNHDECNHGFCGNCTATPQRRRHWKSSIP
jgi:hypothetical protein